MDWYAKYILQSMGKTEEVVIEGDSYEEVEEELRFREAQASEFGIGFRISQEVTYTSKYEDDFFKIR